MCWSSMTITRSHGDVHVLLDVDVLNKTDDGLVAFPFDAIHIDAMLHAAR